MHLKQIFALAAVLESVAALPQIFPQLKSPRRRDGKLVPAIRWDHDDADYNHLVPNDRKRLFYADSNGRQDRAVKHKFLDMDAGFKLKTVVLEHSRYIRHIACSPGQIQVTFDDHKAYDLAKTSWSNQPGLTFVTYKDGCGSSMEKRAFFQSSAVAFERMWQENVANIQASEISARGALSDAKVDWGSHTPQKTTFSLSSHTKRGFGSWNETIAGPDIPIDLKFPRELLADSPWGQVPEIFKTTNGSASNAVYCVDCGVHGELELSGSAAFSLSDGIQSIVAHMTGDMNATLALGIDAQMKMDFTPWEKDLVTLAVPFLEVPDLFFVGPELSLKAQMDITVTDVGTLLGGVNLALGQFDATLDFVNAYNNHVTGFAPSFEDALATTGRMGVSVGLELPVEVGIGIGVPLLDWERAIALVDTPGVRVDAMYSLGYPDGSCMGGVAWNLKLANTVQLNVFNITTIDVLNWKPPALAHGCDKL